MGFLVLWWLYFGLFSCLVFLSVACNGGNAKVYLFLGG